MRILHVIDFGFESGGAEECVRLLKQLGTLRGDDVRVLASDLRGTANFADYTIPTIPQNILKPLCMLLYPRAYSGMKRVLDVFAPDVVHFHTTALLSPSIIFAIGKTPAVMTIHGPEPFIQALIPWCVATQPSLERAGPLGRSVLAMLFTLYFRVLVRPLYRQALARIRLLIAPSTYMERMLLDEFTADKVVHVPNGIVFPKSIPAGSASSILYVGRLSREKGVALLLNAYARIQSQIGDVPLIIVGDGDDAPRLRALAHELGIDSNVVWQGHVAHDRVYEKYAHSAVLAIPSVWPENFPTVAIEALACGLPVVAFDVGGIKEIVVQGENGELVPPGDIEALAITLTRVLSDVSLQARYRMNARPSVQAFSADVFATTQRAVYERALAL